MTLFLNHYFNHGFPDATFEASAKPDPDQPNRMEVTYTIQEGEQVSVDQVLVSGLGPHRPYVVDRELQISSRRPAEPDRHAAIRNRRLYDLGIFSQVDIAVQNPDGDEHEKNVLVQCRKPSATPSTMASGFEFQTGANRPAAPTSPRESWREPARFLSVTRLNFRGRDQPSPSAPTWALATARLAQLQGAPLFDSPKWKLAVTAFYDDTVDVTTFTSQRLEGSVQAEQTIGKSSTMDYRFTYRRVQATNLPINLSLVPLLSLAGAGGWARFQLYSRPARQCFGKHQGQLHHGRCRRGHPDTSVRREDFSRILIQNSTYYAFGKNRPRKTKIRVCPFDCGSGWKTPFANTVLLPPGQCPPHADTPPVHSAARVFLSGGGNSHRGFGLESSGPAGSRYRLSARRWRAIS